mgnify:CR=1 FL=1
MGRRSQTNYKRLEIIEKTYNALFNLATKDKKNASYYLDCKIVGAQPLNGGGGWSVAILAPTRNIAAMMSIQKHVQQAVDGCTAVFV